MHSIKDIAVYIDTNAAQDKLMAAAATLASANDAHLTGIYNCSPPSTLFTASSVGVIPQIVLDHYMKSTRDQEHRMHEQFDKVMKSAGVASSWVVEDGFPADTIPHRFRYADVGLVRQPEEDEPTERQSTLNSIVLGSGRPVLYVPYIGAQETIGRKVVVGWDGSQSATRSLHDALPLLVNAEAVEVIDVDSSKESNRLGISVPAAEHLSRYGINATASSFPKLEISVADQLMNRAFDTGADMIVTGAWGHTRATEYIFGGVTRRMMQSMTVPVWMSH